jgi:hypothetical protein
MKLSIFSESFFGQIIVAVAPDFDFISAKKSQYF